VIEKVQAAFKDLYADPTGLRVIHHDLHHENINVHRGKLHPLDFEDTILGYPVQDIGTAFFDLLLDTKREAYLPLRKAFQQGYESHSSWPARYAEEIDTFQVGYILWWINSRAISWTQNQMRVWIVALEQFLDTGVILKPE